MRTADPHAGILGNIIWEFKLMLNPFFILSVILLILLYMLGVVFYMANNKDTPAWTWPALMSPILLIIVVFSFLIYKIFALLITFLKGLI